MFYEIRKSDSVVRLSQNENEDYFVEPHSTGSDKNLSLMYTIKRN